jgi:hypothetical protein
VLTVFLILFGLPKSLKPEEGDKIAYRQAARIIAQDNRPGRFIRVGATKATRAFEWVVLYAHRRDDALVCAKSLVVDVPTDYHHFVDALDSAGFRYFFYEKSYWPANTFDLATCPYRRDFRLRGEWRHPDSGSLMLLERINAEGDKKS